MPMDDFYSDESDWYRVRSDDVRLRTGNSSEDSFEVSKIMEARSPPDEQLLVTIWKTARRESGKS